MLNLSKANINNNWISYSADLEEKVCVRSCSHVSFSSICRCCCLFVYSLHQHRVNCKSVLFTLVSFGQFNFLVCLSHFRALTSVPVLYVCLSVSQSQSVCLSVSVSICLLVCLLVCLHINEIYYIHRFRLIYLQLLP